LGAAGFFLFEGSSVKLRSSNQGSKNDSRGDNCLGSVRLMLGRFTHLLAAIGGALFLFTTVNTFAAPMRTLPGHVPDIVGRMRPVADVEAKTAMRLSVGLPLRNKAALTNFIEDLYNPDNPQFRHYLTVDQFADQFGPSAEDYEKVVDFLQSRGLAVTARHPNRMVIEVSGAAADVEKAFNVKLRVYQHPTEKRKFFAPDTEPQIDAAVPMLDVMGLDNYILPHPMDLRQPKPVAQNSASVTNFAEAGSGPSGLYIGKDFRTAYVPGVTNAGDGQHIALVEFGPYWTNDIHTYEVAAGLSTNIVISNIFLDGVKEPPATGTDAGEQAIDIEMCLAMAPNAQVIYYGGEIVNNIYSRIASDNKAKQISCSFGFGIDSTTEQLYQEFVAQGQNFFVASGDAGAYVGTINPPAAEPYITVVGGTALYTVSPGGAWQQELAWVGSGGGISTFYAIPNYQQGINMTPIHGSSTMRNFPDVAMMADTVIYIAANNGTGGIGGTSCSSPQWAGFYALANQQAAALGQPPLGFFNPALYALGRSAIYKQCFHDVISGNTTNFSSGPLKFFAAGGYDLCTGWGSPTGSNLINALTDIGTNTFFLYASPVAPAVTIGGSETVLVSEQKMNGSSQVISLSISNLPAGVTASFNPASTSTTSILTLTASTNAIAGTDSFTLLAESSAITQAVTLSLTVVDATPGPTRVNLSTSFNTAAIYRDNTAVSTGADGGGNAYSANLLGTALSWNGCLFTEGPANGNDAVRCAGQTITLPAGQYSSLQILGTAVDGDQLSQPFIVKYTDGTMTAFTQSLSDWTSSENFPGENVVAQTAYRNTSGGTKDTVTQAIVYGYSFGLNNNKTVQSIRLPNNGDVLVFAMTLANDFTTIASPTSLAVNAGAKSTCYVVGGPINGLAGSVNLSVTGLPPGVTAAFSPSSTNASILTLTAAVTAQPVNTTLTLNGAIDGLVHHVNLTLSVVSPAPGALPVNLTSSFNLTGIVSDGSAFSTNGGLDGAGNAYSANLLGASPNWNGVNFSIGPNGAPDAVQCEGQTIALPAGQFTGLVLLGAAINASQPEQVFQINYTDGSIDTETQSVSEWTASQGYAGEWVALSDAYSYSSIGTNDPAQPVNVYGYVFGLNDSRTVQSVTLPNNPDVVVLAMSVGNMATPISLSSVFNRSGIYADGTSYVSNGGADGHGYAYSAIQLGSSLYFDSSLFKFGPTNSSDVVECIGQTVTLPTNRYTSLLLLATGVNGNQLSQTFTVTYTDGTAASIVQSFSDWTTVTSYSNQFTATSMPYRLFSSGSLNASSPHLYGYVLPLNNTKIAQSLKLPSNANLDILAISLADAPLPVSLQGNYNRAGIYSDGNQFGSNAGVDNDGTALSATLLGASESWHNTLFEFGLPNVTNVISAAGQTINLPQGRYSSLMMLAVGVNGSQAGQPFVVNYTNGATTSASVGVSDWVVPQSFTGQTTVETLGYRNTSGGGHDSPGNNIYGYTIALNTANVVKSVKLPNNANVIVLALSLSNYTSAVTEAPVILAQTESFTATNGEPLALFVSAIGTPPLIYQWQLNSNNLSDGGNILGSSTNALNLGIASTGDLGSYDVVITNAYGSVTSSVIALDVAFSFQGVTEAVSGSTNAVSFSWQTTPGANYQVQYTTDLASTNWISLGPPISASNSVSTAIDVLGTDPQRFYRVVQE
jgi:hypothetical protein